MTVIEKIEKLREERGLSQAELEALAQLPRNRVSAWVKRGTEPKAGHLLRVARALNVSLEWLCDDEAAGTPPPGVPTPEVLSDLDRAVLTVARQIGHYEALARLAEHAPLGSGPGHGIAVRDEDRVGPNLKVEPDPERQRPKGQRKPRGV